MPISRPMKRSARPPIPEIGFRIRWPDGTRETCYSPSLVIKDYFAVGTDYPLAEFLQRSRTALCIASERVKAKYGMPCSRALAQLARIEAAAGAFTDVPDARVAVDGFDE
jgi:uncharacterized repeat protein (TIGR04042 family)